MMKIFWATPIFAVCLVFQVFLGAIPSFLIGLVSRRIADSYVYFFNRCFSRTVLFLTGARPNKSGNLEVLKKLEGKPVCYIANHTSMLDIMAVVGSLKVKSGYICKNTLKYVPLFNLSELAMHCVFIDRKNLKKSKIAIDKGSENIKRGIPMLIFPEGTRSKTGDIAPFKHGSFKMATQSNAVIVPITIKYLRRSLEDRKKMFQKTDFFINVGDPVETKGTQDREQQSELVLKVENKIRETYSVLGEANK